MGCPDRSSRLSARRRNHGPEAQSLEGCVSRLADAPIIEADPHAVTTSGHPHVIQTVERGRDAVKRHDWAEAIEALVAVDRDEGLSPDDLVLLGTVAVVGRAARTRRRRRSSGRSPAFTDAGRRIDAAGVALRLAYQAFRSLNVAGRRRLAGAGRAAARRRAGVSRSTPGSLVFHSLGALMATRIDEGIEIAGQAMERRPPHGQRRRAATWR